mgnify:CR=1 FL=1
MTLLSTTSRRYLITATSLICAVLTLIAASGETAQVQILHTTDIHGFVQKSDHLDKGGGFLRLATLIKKHRRNFGPDKTLLIDTGDTIQGTWQAFVNRGQAGIEIMDHLEYDVWVPGNHELDYGIDRLRKLCRKPGISAFAGNLKLKNNDSFRPLPAWRIFQKNGTSIAVIGATASYLRNWFCKKKYRGYQVKKASELLRSIMPDVFRARPDMIILAAHQGWHPNDKRNVNEIDEIVENYPEIDLVVGGHTHWTIAGTRIGEKTWYVQPGAHAEHLAVIRAEINTEKNRVEDISSFLVTADRRVEMDTSSRRVAADLLSKAEEKGQRIAGKTREEISANGTPGVNCEASELIAKAIAEAADSPVVLHGTLSDKSIQKGSVTYNDLFNLLPYENTIMTCRLSPAQLKNIIEEQYDKRKTSAACGLWGINAAISKEGRVLDLKKPGGSQLRGRIKTSLNSYTAAGGGGRFPVLRSILNKKESRLKTTGISTRKAVGDYFRNHSPLKIDCRKWLEIK